MLLYNHEGVIKGMYVCMYILATCKYNYARSHNYYHNNDFPVTVISERI